MVVKFLKASAILTKLLVVKTALYALLYAVCGTMIGGCDTSKTPLFELVFANTEFRVAMLYAAATGEAATLICIIVRMLGPYPACVVGTPPVEVRSGAPV